jgi:ketosteroid isomerase-like protein
MRARFLLVTAMAIGLGTPQIAAADTKADIEARYAQLKVAMAARDAPAIKALLAPKFQSTDVRGDTSDADEMIYDLARFPPNPDRKSETTVKSLTVKGDTALVEQQYDAKMPRQGPDGAPHSMEIIALSDDSWVQSPGGWLLASTVTKDMTIMHDGTVMRHMAKGDAP